MTMVLKSAKPLSKATCDDLVEFALVHKAEQGTTNEAEKFGGLRDSTVRWLDVSDRWDLLFTQIVQQAATKLDMHVDALDWPQFTEYVGPSGRYGWHMDWNPRDGNNRYRAITAIIMLSEPYEYTGGELHVMDGSQQYMTGMKRGDVIAFPSCLLHKVSPVRLGLRQTLVVWGKDYGGDV